MRGRWRHSKCCVKSYFTVRSGPVRGLGRTKRVVCLQRAHAARGSHFSCFAKKSNQKKATPIFALIRDLKRKRRAVRNSLRSNNGPLHRRFHSRSRGRIHGDPFEPIFDRFAMRPNGTRMRASGVRWLSQQVPKINGQRMMVWELRSAKLVNVSAIQRPTVAHPGVSLS